MFIGNAHFFIFLKLDNVSLINGDCYEDNTITSADLDDNVRLTFPGDNGAQNRAGLLGTYYFSVSPSAPLGENFFDLNVVFFMILIVLAIVFLMKILKLLKPPSQ